MKQPKFPKCEKYGIPVLDEMGCSLIEQALTKAEKQGAKAERERIYVLLAKLRNNRFVYNDEMKLAIDMIKDEITR